MRALLPIALLLAACRFDPSTQANSDGGEVVDADPNTPDADLNAPDADPDAPDADPAAPDATPLCEDWAQQPALFNPCVDITEETDNLTLNDFGTYRYNTDLGVLSRPGGGTVEHTNADIAGATAIVAGRFELGPNATLRATGSKPLLVVSWADLVIDGDIDVTTSASPFSLGAGANSSLCSAAENGTTQVEGGGGGGGGGFGGTGGTGGTGHNGDNAGGSGGSAPQTLRLRGGCPGGDGGIGDNATSGNGVGGSGGGAVYLNARTTMTIAGTLHAGGQGGGGASDNRAAGGGGGSGGLVGLEAAQITLQSGAVLAANGGGGGGGGNRGPQLESGTDGKPVGEVAVGGLGADNPVGTGGNGGFVMVANGQDGSGGGRGGGGGGGGVGYVYLSGSLTNSGAVLSPARTAATFVP